MSFPQVLSRRESIFIPSKDSEHARMTDNRQIIEFINRLQRRAFTESEYGSFRLFKVLQKLSYLHPEIHAFDIIHAIIRVLFFKMRCEIMTYLC